METLLAFHGKKTIKNKYLKRVRAHAAADAIIKGTYWEDGKGCAVGCTIEGSQHDRYEIELGIPAQIAHIEDALFESLPNEEAMTFPVRFLESITPGADLSKVVPQLVVWQFEDEKYGIKHLKEIKADKELYKVCEDVAETYKRVLAGEQITNTEWQDLESRADSGYARARARAWAWAWARAGARARAWAGARAWARAGARAGAWADYDRLYAEAITATANKFLELLSEAK